MEDEQDKVIKQQSQNSNQTRHIWTVSREALPNQKQKETNNLNSYCVQNMVLDAFLQTVEHKVIISNLNTQKLKLRII